MTFRVVLDEQNIMVDKQNRPVTVVLVIETYLSG